MAQPYDPYGDEPDPFAPRPGATSTGQNPEPWRWTHQTPPPRAPRTGHYWAWQGGFKDAGGQGWQEVPSGGYGTGAEGVGDGTGEGKFGLSYWKAQGVTPDQIFNLANGQLLPGWRKTALGYERGTTLGGPIPPKKEGTADAPPPGGPGAGGPAPRGGGGGGGGGDPFSGDSWGGAAPMLPYPDFESAGPFVPRRDTFNFDPFQASSWADAENEPGYQASREQLRKQIEAGAAHRGMVLSGMTIGDLYTGLDARAQQNFQQFDDRRYRNWSGDRDLAATKFGLELGVDRDVFDRRATDIDRKNNYRFNVADASFKDALARWTERSRSLTEMARPVV